MSPLPRIAGFSDWFTRRRWRTRLNTWLAEEILPLLGSSRGHDRVLAAGDELARRITRPLRMLLFGAAALDKPGFVHPLQYALAWLSGQEDILLKDETLRAFCDVSTSLAALDRITSAIALELRLDPVDVQLRIAATAPAWREPLILAGRRRLAQGRHDDAIDFAHRALGLMSACPDASRLLTDALRAKRGGDDVPDLRGRFCSRPFEVLVSTQTTRWSASSDANETVMGESYLCDCVAWLPFSIGNVIAAESPDAIWNSAGAQEIRRSILDGDFRYCSRTICPAILNDTLPKREDVAAPRLRDIIDENRVVLPDPPRLLSLGHDASCNLACPTCRPSILMADREQNERLDAARDRVILPLLRGGDSTSLRLTAWGDPFASRHYRSIIEALRDDAYRGVRLFLLTNGLLLTRKQWAAMPHLAERVVALSVSVDAATKETYEDVRRPGRWDVIEGNLRFFGELRRAGNFARDPEGDVSDQVTGFGIYFVVQSSNFREMPAFARLGREIGADYIGFQKYISFGHEAAAYSSKDVASPSHPDHAEFLEILQDPALRDERVTLMQLEGLRIDA